MPDRLIRDELLESDRWLGLRDNTARVAFIALLLKADSFGNMEANPPRLIRLWRDLGIRTANQVSTTLQELQDCDLVRLYEADSKPFLHIPRFGQSLRFIKRIHPLSPWTTDQQKQLLAKFSPGAHPVGTVSSPGAHNRSEVKRSEEKRSDVPEATDKSSNQAGKSQNLLKNPPQPEATPESIAKGKRIASLLVEGKVEEAKKLKAGFA